MTPGSEPASIRDRAVAAVLLSVALLLPVLLLLRPPPEATARAAGWSVVVVVLLAGTAVARSRGPVPEWASTAISVGGVLVIGALRPVFPGTPSLAFAMLVLPVLLSTIWLRRVVAQVVVGLAVVVVAILAATSFDAELAGLHLLFVGGSLVLVHVLLARAVDGQRQLAAALYALASVDPVTGLSSRAAFGPAAASAVDRAVTGGSDVALLLVDVDDFKAVNDRLGHPVGDLALRHLADVVRHGIRTGDALVARLGGDEFAILLPRCGYEVAVIRAEDLLAAVRGEPLVLPDGTVLPLRISIGVAAGPHDGRSFAELYASADTALYAAKRSGREQLGLGA